MRFQERTHVRTFPEAAVCSQSNRCASQILVRHRLLRAQTRMPVLLQCRVLLSRADPVHAEPGCASIRSFSRRPKRAAVDCSCSCSSSRRKRSRHCRRHRRHNVHDRSHSVLSGHSCQRQSTHCHGRQRDQQHQRRQRDQQGHHRARGEEDHRGQGEEEDHPGQGEEEDHRRRGEEADRRRRGEEADRRYQGEEEGRRVETQARYSVRILQRRVSCWPTGSEGSCAT